MSAYMSYEKKGVPFLAKSTVEASLRTQALQYSIPLYCNENSLQHSSSSLKLTKPV